MNKNTLIVLGLMLGTGIASAIVAYLRITHMTAPADLAAKGLSSVRNQALVFYGIFLPVVVGLISLYVFRYLQSHRPESFTNIFHIIAIGLGVLFTVMAAMVFRMRGFVEFTVLHVIYIILFGWVMPILLAK